MDMVRPVEDMNPEMLRLIDKLDAECRQYHGRPLIQGFLELIKDNTPNNPSEETKMMLTQQMVGYYMIQQCMTALGKQNQDLRDRVVDLEKDVKKLCAMIDVLCER